MKKSLSFFIFFIIFLSTSYSTSQTCLTITIYHPGCSTNVGANKEIRFTRYSPSFVSFSLHTNSNGEVYYCFDPDDVTYFVEFPALDCNESCEIYFVPKNIGNFKLVYGCYPNCSCDNDDQSNYKSNYQNIIIDKFELYQNYPNPFNPVTKISFNLPKDDFINLSIYDLNGKLVNNVYSGYISAGLNTFEFDATDYPSGIYIYRLTTTYFDKSNKMVLIK